MRHRLASVIHWWTAPRIAVAGLIVLAVGLAGYLHLEGRLESVASQTCRVQSRGLSAQPYLTQAMGDIATLLTPKPGTKIPPDDKAVYALVGDLRASLASYVAIEDQQPKRRDCAN